MAKPSRFKVGSSGSGKHTEVTGTGEGMGGAASRPAEVGPRIGPGVLARVRPEYDRDRETNTTARPRKIERYSEE